MAKNPNADRLRQVILQEFGEISAAAPPFLYFVKIVCGKQTETDCCCVAGVRPGVYATEVNIQNPNFATNKVLKLVQPLINSGAVVAREPDLTPPEVLMRQHELIELPGFAATMDDCCRIAEMLLGATPSGDTGLTIAILTILSQFELSVSAVYTANPLSGDGISIDVEYIPSRPLTVIGGGPG